MIKTKINVSGCFRNLTKADQLKEIWLSKWAIYAKRSNWQCSKQLAEFKKIWNKTPMYMQKYDQKCFSRNGFDNVIDKFACWKKFIEKKGYRPRVTISDTSMYNSKITETERLEETMLGRWASNVT